MSVYALKTPIGSYLVFLPSCRLLVGYENPISLEASWFCRLVSGRLIKKF